MKEINKIGLSFAALCAICMVLIFGTHAFSADKTPCDNDIPRFCKGVKPGAALMACLEKNESRLSPSCRDYEGRVGGNRMEKKEQIREKVRFRKACNEDVVRLCKDTKPGPGVVIKCLSEHENELSAPCSKMLRTVSQTKEKGTY
jgi:hypothetical protein